MGGKSRKGGTVSKRLISQLKKEGKGGSCGSKKKAGGFKFRELPVDSGKNEGSS
jgi:hypothetical protein